MENTVDVKEEDNTTAKTDLPIENGNDQNLVNTIQETSVSTAANDVPVLNCKADCEPKTTTAVDDVNDMSKVSVSVEANNPDSVEASNSISAVDSNPVSVDTSNSAIIEHHLNVAMASTTISDTVEVKQNSDEVILHEQHKQEIKSENSNDENTNNTSSEHENAEKTLTDELNSTIVGDFEDARDYVEDEYYNDTKQSDDINEHGRVNDDESCDEEEPVENENDLPEDDQAASTVPVPVDDDTNDPQYIPRRGRFYEHDDRMAYSTTTSEESELSDAYGEGSDNGNEDNSLHRRNRKLHIDNKKNKSIDLPEETSVSTDAPLGTSSKKVLAISKVAATTKISSDPPITTNIDGSTKKPNGKKSRDIDALDKWSHDMYNEREQTRKSRDELLSSYGYDIREETEAPRARRHHKYGRASTVKYTRSWQDTKAYSGAGGEKVKRGGIERRNIGSPVNKNKTKSSSAEEYNLEFPTLDSSKPSTESSQKVVIQQVKPSATYYQDKKTTGTASTAGGSSQKPAQITRTSTKNANPSQNRNYREPQNSKSSPLPPPNKNVFNRPSNNYSSKEKDSTLVSRDSPSAMETSNMFNRKLPQPTGGQHHNFKQHYNNTHGVNHGQQNQQQSPSIRGRNFHQFNNNSPQFNRDRYFSKGVTPQSHNSNHYVGSGRIQHSGDNYNHYNNQQYENEVQQVDHQQVPIIRSSKRYSVQSRRELPDPILNFNSMSKITQQSQQQTSVSRQQNSNLIMQESQTTQLQPLPQQIQQAPQQIQQPPPQIQIQQPPMQLQQFHQPMPQINSHHSMVVDPNTGMVLMTADPSMYHHQLYAAPQYGTNVAQGSPGNSAEDQNAAAVAAAALQMLAAQAAVYQPVPTGPAPVTSPPPGTQPIQQQQPPDSFMTTYYQPQAPKQPLPRRVNLAIPIVAPPELNQHHASKVNSSQTPPPTATTN